MCEGRFWGYGCLWPSLLYDIPEDAWETQRVMISCHGNFVKLHENGEEGGEGEGGEWMKTEKRLYNP